MSWLPARFELEPATDRQLRHDFARFADGMPDGSANVH